MIYGVYLLEQNGLVSHGLAWMYFVAVAASFALCASLFMASIATGALVEQSCSRISFFHHLAPWNMAKSG